MLEQLLDEMWLHCALVLIGPRSRQGPGHTNSESYIQADPQQPFGGHPVRRQPRDVKRDHRIPILGSGVSWQQVTVDTQLRAIPGQTMLTAGQEVLTTQ